MNDKVYIAKLGKTVGLKGFVKIYIESDFPEQFKKGKTFTTNKKLTLTIQEYNPDREIIKFKEFDSVEDVKRLTNQELFTSQEDSRDNCELEDGEFFWFDIIGCAIVEGDKTLGVVKEIHRYPVDDYLEVTTSSELVEKELPKNFLIPYIKEEYILNVDLENKSIEVKGAYDILENS